MDDIEQLRGASTVVSTVLPSGNDLDSPTSSHQTIEKITPTQVRPCCSNSQQGGIDSRTESSSSQEKEEQEQNMHNDGIFAAEETPDGPTAAGVEYAAWLRMSARFSQIQN